MAKASNVCTHAKKPSPGRRGRPEEGEKTICVWKPVLLSFYPILLAPLLALLIGLVLLVSFPSPATVLLFSLMVLFGEACFLLARAYCRAFTFSITDWRVRSEFRFIVTRSSEAPLRTVTNIEVFQDLPGRVLNFGSVYITTMSGVPVVFRGVPRPYEVRQLISGTISSVEKVNR